MSKKFSEVIHNVREIGLDEAFDKDKKDPRGGTVMIAVNPFHGGKGKYEVTFKPNKTSIRGRTKGQHISSHHDADEADKAKHDYATKHGYTAMKPIGVKENIEQIDEMPGANMDTRAVHKHLRKSGWALTRTKGSHDVYTHPKSEKHIAVPRHKQLKAPLVRGIMKDAQVSENNEQIDEISDQAKSLYVQKAKSQVKELKPHAKSGEYRDIAKNIIKKREKGIAMATESRGHKILTQKLQQIAIRKKIADDAVARHKAEQEKSKKEKNQSVAEESKDQEHQLKAYILSKQRLLDGGNSLSPGERRLHAQAKRNLKSLRDTHRKKNRVSEEVIKEKLKEQNMISYTEFTKAEGIEEGTKAKQEKGSWQKETDWHKAKSDPIVDKSGAKHTPMSRVKHLARMAARKKVNEQDHNNQVDNVQTPAKKSLALRGVVKNVLKPSKGKKLNSDDKFEPEPELNTQIMRNV